MRAPVACTVALILCAACKGKDAPRPAPTAVSANASAAPSVSSPPPPSSRASSASLDASVDGRATPKPPGIAVAPPTKSTSYCAIFGTYPVSGRANAELGRARLAKTGIPDLEVRDTSDFAELAWGMVVVVSVAKTREEAEARRSKGGPSSKGFAKPCSELAYSFAVSKEPAESRVDADSIGCVGWNPAQKSAVCIDSEGSLQRGYTDTVQFLGSVTAPEFLWLKTGPRVFDAKVDPKTVLKLKSALQKGGHRALTDYRVREIVPGETALWAAPNFSIRYERTKRPDVSTESGSWNDVTDTIVLDCAGKNTTLWTEDVQGADEQRLRLYWHAESASVLAAWHLHYALEGESGQFDHAKWLDIGTLCRAP